MSDLKTTAQLLEIGDTIAASDGDFHVLDVDYMPNDDLVLYVRQIDGKQDEFRMHTRPGAPFTVRQA